MYRPKIVHKGFSLKILTEDTVLPYCTHTPDSSGWVSPSVLHAKVCWEYT